MNADLAEKLTNLTGSADEALRRRCEFYLSNIELYPAARIEHGQLEDLLETHLDKRFSVRPIKDRYGIFDGKPLDPEGKYSVTVCITGMTKESIVTDVSHAKEVLTILETHCRGISALEEVPPAAPDAEATLQIAFEVQLDTLGGDIPHLLHESGSIPRDKNIYPDANVRVINCPRCDAKHLFVYNRKTQSQDSEDRFFGCNGCHRVMLCAAGIPELVTYQVGLAERMPWADEDAPAWRRIESWRPTLADQRTRVLFGAALVVVIGTILIAVLRRRW
jgi:DNA-directed RNA polymerase subunit M/transcription elongation factor TFIIS